MSKSIKTTAAFLFIATLIYSPATAQENNQYSQTQQSEESASDENQTLESETADLEDLSLYYSTIEEAKSEAMKWKNAPRTGKIIDCRPHFRCSTLDGRILIGATMCYKWGWTIFCGEFW